MSSSFEKAVKGATKLKLAPPKSKYIEHILRGTHSGEAGVAEIFRTLQLRLRDSTWTIAFKALIVVHLMIREGERDVTLTFLSHDYRRALALNHYTDVQTQGRNIKVYSQYLTERARTYGKTNQDYVGGASGRLKRLTVDKGLLREVEAIQDQIHALLRCDLFSDEPENEISLTAFRLLIMDLLVLFQVMNEGTINILEKYFEMSKPDAERSLAIYKMFAKQTDLVVRYLSVARQYEQSTRLEIPKIRHAPTSLATSLEEYLKDQDFDLNRTQYLARQESKRTGKPFIAPKSEPKATTSKATSSAQSTTISAPAKGPAPDLIDFFSSIEKNQQPMAQSSVQHQQQQQQQPMYTGQFTGFQQQPTGFPMQQTGMPQQIQNQFMPTQSTNPFGLTQQQPQQQQSTQSTQIQPQYTGAGFGGYTPQPQAQQQSQQLAQSQQPMASDGFQYQHQPLSPQSTNPFRQSVMPQPTGFAGNSNPFGPLPSMPEQYTNQPQSPQSFHQQPQQQPQQQSQQQPQILQPQRTGTNPFARSTPAPTTPVQANTIVSQATGSTNPFRQSMFVNQQTGQGWQTGQQATMGGFEQMPTIPVFPRPGQMQ